MVSDAQPSDAGSIGCGLAGQESTVSGELVISGKFWYTP